jgi:sRNA-binding regulator protein Hfq
MDEEPTTNGTKQKFRPKSYDLIPKLRGKKVTIRLVMGGQPVTGTLEGYNPYELLIQTVKGEVVVFKHAIATIEPLEEPTKAFTV